MVRDSIIFPTFCLGLCLSFQAEGLPAITQAQNKLKQLDAKISHLQRTLTTAHDKKGLLNKELSNTEKQIGEGVRHLRSIQGNMSIKKNKISDLQHKINDLNLQLSQQQNLLAKHVRTRYQMGEYQPLKWLLNQDDPYKINRIFTYYQYMVQSRKDLIDQIDETRRGITENKEKLSHELAENQQLQYQLTEHQKQLEHDKQYHTRLISTLDNEIQTHQHTLQDVQKDKENLSHLLHSLAQQSVVRASKPFAQMRRKLPTPIQNGRRSLRRMNQGVTFFADEGTLVTAVYPGKVVFSDWLKGYGLLLIIDHGQGFMTLYAHNQSLFKRKGQIVMQNEQVAHVGHSGGIKQNGLYFEIRVKGKAVSPLEWLA